MIIRTRGPRVFAPAARRESPKRKRARAAAPAPEAVAAAPLEAEPEPTADEPEGFPEWVTGQLPDRSGMFDYVVIIRAPGDPERLPREARERDMGAEWRRKLMKQPVGAIAEALRQHFADGEARTMNRAGVEMLDKTADVLGGTTFEDALWSLVAAGELEFTMRAPVLFRRAQR